jgi:hypothetical protein
MLEQRNGPFAGEPEAVLEVGDREALPGGGQQVATQPGEGRGGEDEAAGQLDELARVTKWRMTPSRIWGLAFSSRATSPGDGGASPARSKAASTSTDSFDSSPVSWALRPGSATWSPCTESTFCASSHVGTGSWFNLPAVVIVIIITAVLVKGISESATFNGIMVAIKLAAVLFVIGVGLFYINTTNWHPFAPYGWSGLIPPGTASVVNERRRPLGVDLGGRGSRPPVYGGRGGTVEGVHPMCRRIPRRRAERIQPGASTRCQP